MKWEDRAAKETVSSSATFLRSGMADNKSSGAGGPARPHVVPHRRARSGHKHSKAFGLTPRGDGIRLGDRARRA
jgi:hypothetical protein